MTHFTLFLCGDVMTGRGIDQVLPHPSDPRLFEPNVESALEYVALAEAANGPIPRRVSDSYVWGDALELLDRARPHARIINLETSVTTSDEPDPKGINYRMHPGNVGVLTAARIDCCVLANNHVLDWGTHGLLETLDVLSRAKIPVAGAGKDQASALAPAVLPIDAQHRVLVYALGATDSGIPRSWAARDSHPGVHLLRNYSSITVDRIARLVSQSKRAGDVAIASIHWGPNWGYEIDPEHRSFAHALIDHAGVDLVYGHSSHHPKAAEVHRGHLILYGCGDFLTDYEGISGYEEFRDDLVLMYLPRVDADSGVLVELSMFPLQIRNFRLGHPSRSDRSWLEAELNREYQRFGLHVSNDGEAITLASALG